MRNSMNLLPASRPKAVEIAPAQEEVSSVVVLFCLSVIAAKRFGCIADVQLCENAIDGCAEAAKEG